VSTLEEGGLNAQNGDEAAPEHDEAYIKQLEHDLKRAQRKIHSQENLLARMTLDSETKANLSAVIMAERSRQEKYLNLMLEGSPDVIFLLDAAGRVAYCTDVFLRLTGIANFGLINGQLLPEVLRPKQPGRTAREPPHR